MDLKSRLGPFWRELRRRKVVRAGGMYAVSAFVVLQLGEIILPAFNTPDWGLQSLVVAAFLGLPVVLAVAWAYELTSEGLQRTPDAETRSSERVARSLAPRLALLGVTAVSVSLAAIWFSRSFLAASAGGSDLGVPELQSRPDLAGTLASNDPNAPVTAIAVLPLANFAQNDDLFARQLHDEVITQLTRITSLRVVSRTSAERYADSELLLPRIAQELRVQAVVTGSVAMTAESDSVRISIQLLHAPSDTHLMTRTYQREMKDILRLQTEIALEIAGAIEGEITAPAEVPSRVAQVDPEAHRAYLEGWEELDMDDELMGESAGPEALARRQEAAMQHFGEAVRIDSTYGLAWLKLAESALARLAEMEVEPAMLFAEEAAAAGEMPEGAATAGATPDQPPGPDHQGAVLVGRIHESLDRAESLGVAQEDLDAVRIAFTGLLPEGAAGAAREGLTKWLAETGVEADSLSRVYVRDFTSVGRRIALAVAGRGGAEDRRVPDIPAPFAGRAAGRLIEWGQYAQAAEIYRGIVEVDPGNRHAWYRLENMHVLGEDYASAVETREEFIRATEPDTPQREERIRALREVFDEANPGPTYWQTRVQDAEASQGGSHPASYVEQAATALGLGDTEHALSLLDHAVEQREPHLGTLRDSPMWDSLRGHPEFQQIVRRARGVRRPGER